MTKETITQMLSTIESAQKKISEANSTARSWRPGPTTPWMEVESNLNSAHSELHYLKAKLEKELQ